MPQGFTRRVLGGLLAAAVLLIIWRTSQIEQPQSWIPDIPDVPDIIHDHHSDTKVPAAVNNDVQLPDVKIPDAKVPDVVPMDAKPTDPKPDDTNLDDVIPDDPKPNHIKPTERPNTEFPRRRIGKVSMLYGFQNTYYEHALESHQRHADRWGYPMYVLEEDISVGFWNKPSYVLSLIIQELAKPPEERLEWLMWVDADSIIINPAIPADIFLPPPDLDEIHFVSSKDQNGLNTGIVFFHVHSWTVSFLIETLAFPLYFPDWELGVSADQQAMAMVMTKTTLGPDGNGYADGMVYLPRPWINTYEWHHAYEGKKGDMLVHFPGLQEDRWPHMEKWLEIVETTPLEWEVPLHETGYLDLTREFWDKFRAARDLARKVEDEISSAQPGTQVAARRAAVDALRDALRQHADEPEFLQECVDKLEAAITQEASG